MKIDIFFRRKPKSPAVHRGPFIEAQNAGGFMGTTLCPLDQRELDWLEAYDRGAENRHAEAKVAWTLRERLKATGGMKAYEIGAEMRMKEVNFSLDNSHITDL